MSFAHWGPLATRDGTPRPRKMPALDGGIRGILTLWIVAEIEKRLRRKRRARRDSRPCHRFVYLGGTSTVNVSHCADHWVTA